MNFWHTTVVQVKIITLEITFGPTPSPSASPSPVATAAPGDTDATTKKDTDATTKKDTDATTKKDTDATTKKDTDATTKKDTDATTKKDTDATTKKDTAATTKKDTAATTQRGTFSPQMTTKIVSPSRTFKPPVAGPASSPVSSPAPDPPSSGRTCPGRALIEKCNIDCTSLQSFGCTGSNVEARETTGGTFETTWSIGEGSDGDDCNIKCPKEDNLDVTTTCKLNGEKMEWSLPEILNTKCGSSPN